MVTRKLEYLDAALVEAKEAARWYAQRSPTAAAGFVIELEAAAQAITEKPDTWPAYGQGTRRYLLRRYPYSLIYRVETARLVIVAVAHAHRRPGYWKQRPVSFIPSP